MSVNDNTTSLGGEENGVIGTRDFKDYSAKEISTNVSRYNYRSQVKSDKELNEFRQIVYKMVSTWAREDKIAQITEYGDAGQLQKYSNPSEEVINKVLTESIIIHLDPSDLRRLRMDMQRKVDKIRMGMKKGEANRKKVIRSYLNTSGFASAYEKVKDSKNASQYKRNRKHFDKTYKVPKYIQSQYKTLRKELADVLKTCFNKVELVNKAASMDIEIKDGMKQKDIINAIINKVCLFVDLIIGKSKKNYGAAILDPAPYEEILQYTSYSYVVGKPGMDPYAWADLKNAARQAKVAIKERAKLQKKRKRFQNNKLMKDITGGVNSGSISSLARKLKKEDKGVLAEASYEELLKLAGRYGIDPNTFKNKNVAVLKAKIYNSMAYEQRRINKLTNKEFGMETRNSGGKKRRRVNDLLSVYRTSQNGNSENIGSQTNSFDLNVPIIEFSRDGSSRTIINRAVPVYIVGQGLAGGKEQKSSREILNSKKLDDAGSMNTLLKKGGRKVSQTNSRSQLSSKELAILDTFLLMEFYKPGKSELSSLDKVKILIEKTCGKKLVNTILVDSGLKTPEYDSAGNPVPGTKLSEQLSADESKLFELRIRFCFVYAKLKKLNNLADYLTNCYGIFYKIKNLKKRTAIITSIATLGIGGLVIGAASVIKSIGKFFGGIKDRIHTDKFPKDKSELSQKSLAIYNQLKNKRLIDIKTLINSSGLGFNNAIIDKYYSMDTNGDNALRTLVESFLKAVYANLISDKPLMNLYLYEGDIIDEKGKPKNVPVYNDFKLATKKSIFRKIKGGFKNIGRTAKSIFRKERIPGAEDIDAKVSNDNGDNMTNNDNRLLIPKLNYLGKGKVDEEKINEVVPVYVVNGMPTFDKEELKEMFPLPTNKLKTLLDGISGIVKKYLKKSSDTIVTSINSSSTNIENKIEIINNSINNSVSSINSNISNINSAISTSTSTINSKLDAVIVAISNINTGGKSGGNPTPKYNPLPHGSGGRNSSGNGITNAELTLIDYGRARGMDKVKGKLIKLTGYDPNVPGSGREVANEADGFVGRKGLEISRFPKDGWYRPTKATIAWALQNGKTFATGGETFSDIYITGDAKGKNIFANGAKPELVETFSKTPVFSRITPIKKFAEGGSTLSNIKDYGKQDFNNGLLNNIFNSSNKKLEKEMKKLEEIQADIQMRSNIAQAIQQFGGEVPDDINTAKPKKLIKSLTKALKAYNKKIKNEKKSSSGKSTNKISADTKALGIKEIDTSAKTMPVFITNEFANGRTLLNEIDAIKLTLTDNFSTLFSGLGGPWVMTAPMGVGAVTNPLLLGTGIANKIASTASVAISTGAQLLGEALGAATGGHVTTAATGGLIKAPKKKNGNLIKNTPRLATGGSSINSVITGDAPGKNIFAGGAKPELVKSTGDMDIIPLNKTGTEKKTKIDRMTPEERKNALATAISSHVVKFNYKLPDGVSEVSNEGEAIKVFDVKPGIDDLINIDGNDVSLIRVLLGIQTQLTALLTSSTTNGQLLGVVAAKPSSTIVASGDSVNTNPNPFAGGFPSSLDNILGGK